MPSVILATAGTTRPNLQYGIIHKAPGAARPQLYVQLRVEYADGYTETLVTDKQWKASTGPVCSTAFMEARPTTRGWRNRAGPAAFTIPIGSRRKWSSLRQAARRPN